MKNTCLHMFGKNYRVFLNFKNDSYIIIEFSLSVVACFQTLHFCDSSNITENIDIIKKE